MLNRVELVGLARGPVATVSVAEARIRRSITPDDQVRLVDRYASQLKEAR